LPDKNDVSSENVAKLLLIYLELLDSYRFPVGRLPLRKRVKLGVFWELNGSLLSKYDEKFERELMKEIKVFLRERTSFCLDLNNLSKTFVKTFITIFILLLLFLIFIILLFPLKTFFDVIVFFTGFTLVILVPMVFFIPRDVKKYQNVVAEANDEKLRELAQQVIDYSRDFFKKGNLNPELYEIDLKHKDYKNLIYEEKKRVYTAYLNKEV
jgi:hypothetical protein